MVASTYISGRGGESAALSGAEGACSEHDECFGGGLEERNWVFVVMVWKERKDGSGEMEGRAVGKSARTAL